MSSRTVKTMGKKLGKMRQELELSQRALANTQAKLRQALVRKEEAAALEDRFKSLMVRVERDPASQYSEMYALRLMFRPEAFLRSSYARGRGMFNIYAEIDEMAYLVASDVEREVKKTLLTKSGAGVR
jgi:hypothetical protein